MVVVRYMGFTFREGIDRCGGDAVLAAQAGRRDGSCVDEPVHGHRGQPQQGGCFFHGEQFSGSHVGHCSLVVLVGG